LMLSVVEDGLDSRDSSVLGMCPTKRDERETRTGATDVERHRAARSLDHMGGAVTVPRRGGVRQPGAWWAMVASGRRR
jgi:hypothetical protein